MTRKRRNSASITLAEVAKAADVSAITASRALRTPEVVSVPVRERVEAAVRALGYVPNPAARALASARTNIIGVIIPSVTNAVFADVMRGIYDAVEGTPHQVQLGNTRYTTAKEEELLEVFAAQRPAGLIVAGTDQSERARKLLASLPCPLVQIMDLGADPVDMLIGFSHRDAAQAATQHLIDKRYRRIGFLGARMDPRTQRRLDGYTDATTRAGIFDDKLIYTTPRPSSVQLGAQMLGDFLSMVPDADAVFCNNDDLALGALFECQRRRIRIPLDFGIVGFNDLDPTAASCPTLSTIRTHRYEMGHKAVEMLFSAIDGTRPEPTIVDLGHELIARESTARP
jgi:LacI family transcriptional regulator, gluconate utilization system Gnt-I transcriptional repressor